MSQNKAPCSITVSFDEATIASRAWQAARVVHFVMAAAGPKAPARCPPVAEDGITKAVATA